MAGDDWAPVKATVDDGDWQPVGPKGVTVPEGIPAAMEARLEAGAEARKREGGLLQTIPQGIEMISTPEGRTKLWEAVKKYPSKFIDDTINMGKLPGDVAAGRIDLTTEEGMDQAIGLGMLVAGSRLNKLSLTGKTSGLGVNFGEPVSRISKGPMGEIYDLPIGTAARSEDFVTASQIVAGEASPPDFILYRGTARDIDRFDIGRVGKGGQEYGHGLYFTENEQIASSFAQSTARSEFGGKEPSVYRVRVKEDPQKFLDWDATIADQSPPVRDALDRMGYTELTMTGGQVYTDISTRSKILSMLSGGADSPSKMASAELKDAGIPGIVNRLQSKSTGADYKNFVVFDDKNLEITHKNGVSTGSLSEIHSADGVEVAPMAVQQKMLRAYEEKGIHPSELAHDAMSDPIVAQRLLSSDKADLPPGGPPPEPPGPPKPPPEPPKPPPEGSFEAAQKTILDKISVDAKAPKEGWSWDKFYTQAVDDLHPLKEVDKGAYDLARLTRGQFGKAEHFLEHGTFDFHTYKTNGKPLREILAPVRDDLDGVRAFLASKRAVEIEASGRKSGMDLEAAQRVIAEGEGKYGKIAEEVVEYQRAGLKYLKDSGVLSDEAFTAMTEAGKSYIPFYRMIGEGEKGGGGAGKSFGPGNPVKRLKGSERDIIDPLESIIKNTYAYISIAERNAVGIKLVDALKADGAEVKVARGRGKDPELVEYLKEKGVTDPEAIVDFVKSAIPEEGGDTLGAFRNGVKETVKVNDPELVTAFRGLEQSSANMLMKVLAVPAQTLRAGAVLAPDFIARNIVRDFMTAFVNSKGFFSPVDSAKGLVGYIRKDADFLNWLKGGGANSTMVALDRRYMQESLQKLNSETGLMDRAWNVVKHPISSSLAPLRMMSELAENATRLGEFKKLTGEGKEMIQSAALASRDVSMDFARIGASMRAVNMITAFAAAQVNGLSRVGEAFINRPFNTTAKVAGGITLPSVLLWFANRDDERVKDLPAWQKDMFWIVATKDHLYRIPKPFELGVIFGSGAERVLDATIGKNPEAFEHFGKSMFNILWPNVIPTAAIPIAEQFANRSSFSDRTLIPQNMEKHLPEYQYTPYTTELSKKLGQVVSAFPGMRASAVGPGAPFGPIARTVTSPILLENYIRAWTGGLGVYAMQAADLGLRKAGVLPDVVGPTPTLADIPVVRAFIVRYPSATTQSIQDFYDQHEVTKKFYDTWLSKAKEGDADAMSRIQAAGGPMMFVRLDAIKETLTDHGKLVRDIYKNPTMKPEEKRQLIDSLYFNMIEIGKAGKGMVVEAEKALKKPADAAP